MSDRACLHCGIALPDRLGCRGRPAKFCSRACRDAHSRQVRSSISSERRCAQCGMKLNMLQVGTACRFCSMKCARAARRSLKGTVRQCVVCGAEFEPYQREQSCCSQRCGSIKAMRTQKERGIPTRSMICTRCGKTFEVPQYTGAVRWVMCPSCRRECDRDRCRRRRTLTADLLMDEIIDHEVFERDRWICQLCGEPVSPECRWPDPLSPSIDHIVPLSMGGEHSIDNVQLAHLGCNSRKGNRVAFGVLCEAGSQSQHS